MYETSDFERLFLMITLRFDYIRTMHVNGFTTISTVSQQYRRES